MRKTYTLGSLLTAIVLAIVFTLNPISASAKTYSWGFTKASGDKPIDLGSELESVTKKYDAIYIGKTDKKVIYLTFDNGFENGYTESILDTLKKENVPATFFLTGHYLKSASDLVKRMIKDGHIIGNHSLWTPKYGATL